MNRYNLIALLLAALLVAGCRSPGTGELVASSKQSRDHLNSAQPTTKQILAMLLANCDVPLTVDSSCSGVGAEAADSTIGDYVGGLLAQLDESKDQNWIEVTCRPKPATTLIRSWECSVVFQHIAGEERGGWGVTFLVDVATWKVLRDSFKCTGAG